MHGTIPSELGLLTSLTKLGFGGNQITGTIATQLGLLENLDHLEAKNNHITGSLPTQLGQLHNVRHKIRFNNNQLTGTLPTQLGLLTKLWVLEVQNNTLNGEIPSETGLMPLIWLNLQDNDFSGTIPDAVLDMHGSFWDPFGEDGPTNTYVLSLNVSGNEQLMGTFPDDYCADNVVNFDCSDLLCGCDCNCTKARE